MCFFLLFGRLLPHFVPQKQAFRGSPTSRGSFLRLRFGKGLSPFPYNPCRKKTFFNASDQVLTQPFLEVVINPKKN